MDEEFGVAVATNDLLRAADADRDCYERRGQQTVERESSIELFVRQESFSPLKSSI